MRIKVDVTSRELDEMGFDSTEELKAQIIDDLDNARDYPGYDVDVEIFDE